MQLDQDELQTQAARVEALVEEMESLPDPARAKMAELVQRLLDIYGSGLARMLEIVAQESDAAGGARTLRALASDDLVSHLLMLHDLHPVDLTERVEQALEQVRPYLQSHGGNVELLGVEEGIAHLRLTGHCGSCPSSTITLRTAVEEAIHKTAPDLIGIEAESAAAVPERASGTVVPLSSIMVCAK
jgi:Fe-S cluster biogenesis protein NfuA